MNVHKKCKYLTSDDTSGSMLGGIQAPLGA